MTRRVLALSKYDADAASTRQRLLQFVPSLNDAGFQIDVRPFFTDGHMQKLSDGRRQSPIATLAAYRRRFADLAGASKADLLWIYSELFPYLPASFERLAAKSGTPYIYDLDDAFFHAHERHALLRDKLAPLITGAAAVTAGNPYLADYARRFNRSVHVFPTVVDTEVYLPASRPSNTVPVIGWIGSPSTWAYVRPFLPTLAKVCADGRARFLAVGAGKGAERDLFDWMELRDWSEASEIGDIQSMDIGIMPLPDEPWARGKCGYKLIQYMACGLPVVASPVGVNQRIVSEGSDGFLVSQVGDWKRALEHLVASPDIRVRLGEQGRERVVSDYSLGRWAPEIVSLFERVLREGPARKD